MTALKCGLGVGFAGLIAVLVAKAPSPLAFPIAIFVALVLFNLAVAVFDIPAPLLRQDGWVVPMLAGTALWPPILPADISSVDWTAIIPTAVMLPGIIVVSVMAIMMNASGIELATRRDIELDQELLSVGLQNVVAGSGGGIPGYPAVSLSVLANRLGAGNRGVGIVGAALVACVLFLGEAVLNLVPTPLLGSVLVWIGATVTWEWLVQTARRLAVLEYIVVVLIFLVIVFVSLGVGILRRVGRGGRPVCCGVWEDRQRQADPWRRGLSEHLRNLRRAPGNPSPARHGDHDRSTPGIHFLRVIGPAAQAT